MQYNYYRNVMLEWIGRLAPRAPRSGGERGTFVESPRHQELTPSRFVPSPRRARSDAPHLSGSWRANTSKILTRIGTMNWVGSWFGAPDLAGRSADRLKPGLQTIGSWRGTSEKAQGQSRT